MVHQQPDRESGVVGRTARMGGSRVARTLGVELVHDAEVGDFGSK